MDLGKYKKVPSMWACVFWNGVTVDDSEIKEINVTVQHVWPINKIYWFDPKVGEKQLRFLKTYYWKCLN